MRIALILNNH